MIGSPDMRTGWFLVAAILCGGCSSSASKPAMPPVNQDATSDGQSDAAAPGTAAAPKKTEAKRLEPFEAPPLAEIDAKANWVEQRVKNGPQLAADYWASQTPGATVPEALGLTNNSAANNVKILGALGRPPESKAAVNYGATLNRRVNGDINSTNPVLSSSAIDSEVLGLTALYLFSNDWTLTPHARAEYVQSWQASGDRMYDKVVLRGDITWSDGRPVTAHDVEFSFQAIMNPNVPSIAVRSLVEKLRWVKAYDDRTVIYFHREPLATNESNVWFPLIPKHIYEDSIKDDPTLTTSRHHVKHELAPVCGGPYKIAKWSRDQEILLTRRDEWHQHNGQQVREKPYFKEMRFRIIKDSNTALLALKGKDLDECEITPEQWATQTTGSDFSHCTKVRDVQWVYFYFGWNNDPVKAPFFTDKRVRQAMSYAFDHEEMLSKIWLGLYEPANGIYHHTAWTYPQDAKPPYTQDLDKAQDLLEAAGWADHDNDGVLDKQIGGHTVKFEFTVQCGESPETVAVCELLKSNLDQIGIVCHIKPTEWTVMQDDNQKHNFQAYFAGWGTGSDPDTAENLWGTGKDRNYVQYSNPKVDELFAQGRREFDRQKRAAIYGQIHNMLYEDQPYTWLYFRNSFYGFDKSLRGYKFSPRGPYSYHPGAESIYQVAQ